MEIFHLEAMHCEMNGFITLYQMVMETRKDDPQQLHAAFVQLHSAFVEQDSTFEDEDMQHDAEECLTSILNILSQEVALQGGVVGDTNWVSHQFGGVLATKTFCNEEYNIVNHFYLNC